MISERTHPARARLIIALPLVAALLAASLLLWSRYDPVRDSAFCSTVTAELELIALDLQVEDTRLQDVQWVLYELVERVDVQRLASNVPADLRADADLLVKLDAAHDRDVDAALARGEKPPPPSPALVASFLRMAARYAEDCTSSSLPPGLDELIPTGNGTPPDGQ